MNICILFYINNNSIKYSQWHDGFTKAISILSKKYNVKMINMYDNTKIDFSNYDYVFFKESFDGSIYNKYKSSLPVNIKLGLFISASYCIPNDNQIKMYDVLFYETYWYYNYAKLNRHNHAYHAFGVDTTVMKPINTEKQYDVIFVGDVCNYKRPLKILDLDGSKICLGFKSNINLVNILEKNDVEVKEFIEYEKLVDYYNQSKLCYIPCELHGGGERAVLEARACGIPVKIEADNPKLKELCVSEIYSSEYYANQIEYGLKQTLMTKILFIHCLINNAGDDFSSIARITGNENINIIKRNTYSELNLNEVCSLTENLIKIIVENKIVIIGGGGLINQSIKWNKFINLSIKYSSHTILYGIGKNTHLQDINFYEPINFDTPNVLYGTRDWPPQNTNGQNYNYVPCPSCMLINIPKIPNIVRKIGLVQHAWFEIKIDVDDENLEILKNTEMVSMNTSKNSIESILSFIYSSEYILTNTYHGYYWSLLSNKKVILLDKWSTNFDKMKWSTNLYKKGIPIYEQFDNILPNPGLLKECVEYNDKFLQNILRFVSF